MNIQTIISIVGLLGIGSLIGTYFTAIFEKRKVYDIKNHEIKENRYRSTLVWMRILLNPENINQFELNDPYVPRTKDIETIKKYTFAKLKEFYYNSLLYASDGVLQKIRLFCDTPNETNYFQTALEMRKNLWDKSCRKLSQLG
ncbi:MAG: hypothetical protein WC496_10620 [Phycisphaerae bacterium]|jgi:hypothetical protein